MPIRAIFYATSFKNSFGVEYGYFDYGKPAITQIELNHQATIFLKPKMYKYLPEKKGLRCNEKTFYEAVEEVFVDQVKEMCPFGNCAPILTPNETIPICKEGIHTFQAYKCSAEEYNKILDSIDFNKNPCEIIEYEDVYSDESKIIGMKKIYDWAPANLIDKDLSENEDIDTDLTEPATWWDWDFDPEKKNPIIKMSYQFDRPESMTLHEEYTVANVMDLIGIVGGTLGLYIGFAFYDVFFLLLDYVVILVKKLMNFIRNKQEEKLNTKPPAKKIMDGKNQGMESKKQPHLKKQEDLEKKTSTKENVDGKNQVIKGKNQPSPNKNIKKPQGKLVNDAKVGPKPTVTVVHVKEDEIAKKTFGENDANVKNDVTESQDQPSKKSVDVVVHIQEAKISKNHVVDDSHDQQKPSNKSGEEHLGEDANTDTVAVKEANGKDIADGIS